MGYIRNQLLGKLLSNDGYITLYSLTRARNYVGTLIFPKI